jgi:serine/threonine-protein kinase
MAETAPPRISIPNLRFKSELGRGGMGVVYLAEQESLRREVAVKVFPLRDVKESLLQRFFREVQLCTALSHPHVIKLLDAGSTSEWAYLAMEYVDGQPLDRWVFDRGPMRANQLLVTMEDLTDAVDFVHSQRIVHRDIKTSNVMVSRSGSLKLMDFGLARMEENSTITETGTVVGSPRYLAPETVSAGVMNEGSDLYSLGLLFFEVATGTRPFDGLNLRQTLDAIVNKRMDPPSRIESGVPAEVDELILRLLDKDPKRRFPDARSLLARVRDLRAMPAFVGTSWETSRPDLNLTLTPGPAKPGPQSVRPPAEEVEDPHPTDARVARAPGGRSSRTGRSPSVSSSGSGAAASAAAPESVLRRMLAHRGAAVAVTVAASLAAAAGVAGVAAIVLRPPSGRRPEAASGPVGPASGRPDPASRASPLSSAPPERPADPREAAIERLWSHVSRIDMRAQLEEIVRVLGVRRGAAGGEAREREAAAKARALLARRPFHGSFLDACGSGEPGRGGDAAAGSPSGAGRGSPLADTALSMAARSRLYEALLPLAHIDWLLQVQCGAGEVLGVQRLLDPWSSILTPSAGHAARDIERLCRDAPAGGQCVLLHRNPMKTSLYLFSGFVPVPEEMTYVAGDPSPTGYRKQEDRPHPRVVLPGPYRELRIFAMAQYLYPERFLRLDFTALDSLSSPEPPPEARTRTVIVRAAESPTRPEATLIAGTGVSADLLAPGTYEMRVRAYRLSGTEAHGCRVSRIVAQVVP